MRIKVVNNKVGTVEMGKGVVLREGKDGEVKAMVKTLPTCKKKERHIINSVPYNTYKYLANFSKSHTLT